MDLFGFTSEQLHDDYATLYDQFFASHAIVCSAPLTFRWASIGIMQKDAIPTLISKLPLRVYLGISPDQEPGVHFGSVTYFSFSSQNFEESPAHQWEEKLEDLAQEIATMCETNKKGYRYDLLIEADKFIGIGVFSSICSCCAYRLAQISEKCSDVALLSKHFEKVFKGAYTSFDRALALSLPESSTLVYGELYKPLSYEIFPFDFALLYSGIPVSGDVRRRPHITHHFKKEFLERDALIRVLFEKIGSKNNIPLFSDHIEGFMQSLQAFFNKQVIKAFEHALPLQDISDIVATQNFITQLHTYINGEDGFIVEFEHLYDDETAYGILPLFTGIKGGSYLVCMPLGLLRENLQRLLESMQDNFPSVTMLYQSRGSAQPDALRVDQNLLKSHRSERTKHDNGLYINNQGIREVGSLQELVKKRGKQGLFLDSIERKIFAFGHKLTSKHFESQTTTIELLELCLEHYGQPITNEQLGYSTMTRQYNQFLGKIIAPLKQVSRDFFGKEIDIETHGTFRDFSIQLNEEQICIGILKKI